MQEKSWTIPNSEGGYQEQQPKKHMCESAKKALAPQKGERAAGARSAAGTREIESRGQSEGGLKEDSKIEFQRYTSAYGVGSTGHRFS